LATNEDLPEIISGATGLILWAAPAIIVDQDTSSCLSFKDRV
jgi:hypothetical protein